MNHPYRLVVELRASGKTSVASHFAANRSAANASASLDTAAVPKAAPVASWTAKASEQVVPVKAFPARTGKIRIVLDAGHGGWDLGTVGREGLLEKDLVLDVTQRLGKLLQARLGAEVMFTRTDDTYLPLEQRADIANQAQADLFVSVHANYSSSAAARGVETYYTNSFSAPGSREVERHEDGTFAKLTPVSLTAGGLHEKIEESRRLASSVQRALYATLSATSPDIRNRGSRTRRLRCLPELPCRRFLLIPLCSPAENVTCRVPLTGNRSRKRFIRGLLGIGKALLGRGLRSCKLLLRGGRRGPQRLKPSMDIIRYRSGKPLRHPKARTNARTMSCAELRSAGRRGAQSLRERFHSHQV